MLPTINAILTLLGFVGLSWFLFGGYRKRRTEQFQQEVLGLKRKMAIWARPSGIASDHPAYRQLADAMSGMTKIGLRVMLFSFIWNRDTRPVTFKRRLEISFQSLDENAKSRLLEFLEGMHLTTLRYLILSPVVILTVIPFVSALVLLHYDKPTLMNFCEPAFDRLDDVALAEEREVEDILIPCMTQPTIERASEDSLALRIEDRRESDRSPSLPA